MSVEEILGKIQSLKQDTKELSAGMAATGQNLQQNSTQLLALVRGSSSGQTAVSAVSMAVRALQDSALSLRELERECEGFLARNS